MAVAIDGPLVGRHIFEGDVLYTAVPPEHAREIMRRSYLVPASFVELLKEIAAVRKSREEL